MKLQKMLYYIKRSFYHIKKWWQKLLIEQQHPEIIDCCANNNDSPLIIKSFISNDFVLVSHKNVPNKSLRLPLRSPLYFNINDIIDELNRFISFENYKKLTSTKYKKKRLVIYLNNPLLIGLIEYIIKHDNYNSYHIFCNNDESFNTFKLLAQRNKKIRLNEPEKLIPSLFRITRNEYGDIYNDILVNDTTIIFLSKCNTINEIVEILKWNKNCLINIPSNKFLFALLSHVMRYYCNINIIYDYNGYMLIEVKKNNEKLITTEIVLNKIIKVWNKYKQILFPMYCMLLFNI